MWDGVLEIRQRGVLAKDGNGAGVLLSRMEVLLNRLRDVHEMQQQQLEID
jgi:hypothetical protein